MDEIIEYIATVLANPRAAASLANKIAACYDDLSRTSYMYGQCLNLRLQTFGYRGVSAFRNISWCTALTKPTKPSMFSASSTASAIMSDWSDTELIYAGKWQLVGLLQSHQHISICHRHLSGIGWFALMPNCKE